MAELKEVEFDDIEKAGRMMDAQDSTTHAMTEAEVERIHKHGSPHQHLDPNPHPTELSYMERQRLQVIEKAKAKRDAMREEIGEKLKPHLPKKVIPRYLRRALWSKDKLKIAKAIRKALVDGWTKAEMLRQVKLLSEHNQQTKEYEIQTE